MKSYYRIKGKFKDGRNRLVIEWEEADKIKSIALPKPEKLHEILDRFKSTKFTKENS